jgi:hypothetical protein
LAQKKISKKSFFDVVAPLELAKIGHKKKL